MSFIYRDSLAPAVAEWNRASTLYQRFSKVWPVTTIDGIQVYSGSMIYWQGVLRSDKPFKRFITSLGVPYSLLESQKYKGMKYAYFSLNMNKYTYKAPSVRDIVTKINYVFTIGDEVELSIHYNGESKRVVDTHWTLTGNDPTDIASYSIDTVAIRNTLHSDPIKYFANASEEPAGTLIYRSLSLTSFDKSQLTSNPPTPKSTPITQVTYDKATTNIYSTLALLDNGSTFQQVGNIYKETLTSSVSSDGSLNCIYSYKIKFKVIADISINSYITTKIKELCDIMEDSLKYTRPSKLTVIKSTNGVVDTSLKEACMSLNENITIAGLTYKGHLTVEGAADMKRKDFVTLISKVFGGGYKEKDSKWYEVVIGIVLLVIAVVTSLVTYGASLSAYGALMAASMAFASASLTLSIGGLIYSSAFPHATDMIKIIGKFAQITGLITTITGAWASLQSAFNRAAQNAVASNTISNVSEYTVTQFVKDMVTSLYENIKSSIADNITAITNVNNWSMPSLNSITLHDVSGWIDTLSTSAKMYMKFFGDSKQFSTFTEEDQASKEDGVEKVFLTYNMLSDQDALSKIDTLVNNNNGGKKTENFLIQIA